MCRRSLLTETIANVVVSGPSNPRRYANEFGSETEPSTEHQQHLSFASVMTFVWFMELCGICLSPGCCCLRGGFVKNFSKPRRRPRSRVCRRLLQINATNAVASWAIDLIQSKYSHSGQQSLSYCRQSNPDCSFRSIWPSSWCSLPLSQCLFSPPRLGQLFRRLDPA